MEIEAINWQEFETAYGNAEKIPAYVRELDIFLGFAVCTETTTPENTWAAGLQQKLRDPAPVFKELSASPNELIADFARAILASLRKQSL